jgi:hypothetical protein
MARLAPGNLYQRILDEAQRRRRQAPDRLAQQIERIEARGKAHGNQSAQEQRQGEQDDETGARRITAL